MPIRMNLSRILICETSDSHIVELREVDGDRVFPITIGLAEAAAIERRLMGTQVPRPQTHDLLANVIEQLGWAVDHILINDLRNRTFYAELHLSRDGETMAVDSRPSDAIALGVATDVPIYVNEAVLEEVCRPA